MLDGINNPFHAGLGGLEIFLGKRAPFDETDFSIGRSEFDIAWDGDAVGVFALGKCVEGELEVFPKKLGSGLPIRRLVDSS